MAVVALELSRQGGLEVVLLQFARNEVMVSTRAQKVAMMETQLIVTAEAAHEQWKQAGHETDILQFARSAEME